jgi:hypothetical protein
MRDALKDFIQKNREGFKEKPSDDLWKKINTALKQEDDLNKPKNISTMLKYGFGASVIVAGAFVLMNLQKEKTQTLSMVSDTRREGIKNGKSLKTRVEIPASSQINRGTPNLFPAKKNGMLKGLKQFPDSLAKQLIDTAREIIIPKADPPVLYANHPPVSDSLDINNWPMAGSQWRRYKFSGDHTTGKTIGSFKSVSNKINGFITAMQSNMVDKYLGKRIRMTGYVRTENVAEWAGLWMRVGIKGGDEALAFDNMRYGKKDRSIKGTTERTKYEIVLDVPQNSANIIYGVMLVGTGQIYFDSFILEVVDETVPTTGGDPDGLGHYKTDRVKSYNPRNFWRWYVVGRKISKDGTWNIDLEPNNF